MVSNTVAEHNAHSDAGNPHPQQKLAQHARSVGVELQSPQPPTEIISRSPNLGQNETQASSSNVEEAGSSGQVNSTICFAQEGCGVCAAARHKRSPHP
jgi:hypothetical protein